MCEKENMQWKCLYHYEYAGTDTLSASFPKKVLGIMSPFNIDFRHWPQICPVGKSSSYISIKFYYVALCL